MLRLGIGNPAAFFKCIQKVDYNHFLNNMFYTIPTGAQEVNKTPSFLTRIIYFSW